MRSGIHRLIEPRATRESSGLCDSLDNLIGCRLNWAITGFSLQPVLWLVESCGELEPLPGRLADEP